MEAHVESPIRNNQSSDIVGEGKVDDVEEELIIELENDEVDNNLSVQGVMNETQEKELNDQVAVEDISIKSKTSKPDVVISSEKLKCLDNTVTVYRFFGTHVDLNLNDQNSIVIFCKRFSNIFVALYKGHEYVQFRFKHDFEEAWRCNKTQTCPALLLIGKHLFSNKVYEVSKHNCDEPENILNNKIFMLYTAVNVIYYKGDDIPGLENGCLSSVDSSLLILCQDEKFHILMAFCNGYKYVKQASSRHIWKYRCSSNSCKGSLNISIAGLSKKKVFVIESHTCKQNQTTSLTNEPIYVPPDGFTSVKAFHCKTNQELIFFLKIYKLYPSSELLLIPANEQGVQKTVYYKGYDYCKRTSTMNGYYCCSTKKCSGQLRVDFKAVSEIRKHTCSIEMAPRVSHTYTLFKISNFSDMNSEARNCANNTFISSENNTNTKKPLNTFTSKAEYVRVNFKHLVNQNPSTIHLDPNDTETVVIWTNTRSQHQEYYYKGYTYHSGNRLHLALCSKLESCAAGLVLSQESSEVKEFGQHICVGSSNSSKQEYHSVVHNKERSKSEGRSSTLNSTVSKKWKSLETILHKSEPSPSHHRMETMNCFQNKINVTKLNPSDSSTSHFYRDEKGQPIISYKGHTYNCKSRTIYMCSKSLRCSAALKPHNNRNNKFIEIGEHNCTLTKNQNNHNICKPESVIFKTYVANEFSEIPDFNPNDKTTVTMLLSRAKCNAVYYKGFMYVDDRSLSCERGSYITEKSCNLIYLCIKSTVCSAGLLMNFQKTKARQVGLHNCLKCNQEIHSTKNFRELKRIKMYHSSEGKSDLNREHVLVATVCNNGKTTFYYNDHAYVVKATCCSCKLGCKCLYICKNHGYCSAALLHLRREVLEIGLHSCREDIVTRELVSIFTTFKVDYSSFNKYGNKEIFKKHVKASTFTPSKSKESADNVNKDMYYFRFQPNITYTSSNPNTDSLDSVDNGISTENNPVYEDLVTIKEESLEKYEESELKIEEMRINEEHDYVEDIIKREVVEDSDEANKDCLKQDNTEVIHCDFKTEFVHCTDDNTPEELLVLDQNDPLSYPSENDTTNCLVNINAKTNCEMQLSLIEDQIISSAISEHRVINVKQAVDENIGVYLSDFGCLVPSLVPFNIPKTTKTFSIVPYFQETVQAPEDTILYQPLPKSARIETAISNENEDVVQCDQGNRRAPILERYLAKSDKETNGNAKPLIVTGSVMRNEIRCPSKLPDHQTNQTKLPEKRKAKNPDVFEDIEDAIPATIVMSTKKLKV